MNAYVYERLYHWLYATEGNVPYMYLDSLGLVTVGIGFMIDPIEKYIDVWGGRFRKADGRAATRDDVLAEAHRLKEPDMQKLKGAHLNFKDGAQVFLLASAVKPGVTEKLRDKERALKSAPFNEFFANFDDFPPDAQMGLLSTAYGFLRDKTPEEQAFNRACKGLDWHGAAQSGRWTGWRPEKQRGHQLMFENAQVEKDRGYLTNSMPAFPGTLFADGSYDREDHIRPYGQDIWKAGGGP
jgi:hypothetical protein